MSISEIRTSIRTWLNENVRIDKWDLDYPENQKVLIANVYHPANSAIEDPIGNFSLIKWNGNQPVVKTTFRYYLIYRFNGNCSRHQLPVATYEDFKEWILFQFLTQKVCLGNVVKEVAIPEDDNPLIISKVQGEDSDWLLIISLPLEITFISNPINPFEDTDQETIRVKKIQIDIWKSEIPTITNPDLDSTFIKEFE
jgi:hypothetical protein